MSVVVRCGVDCQHEDVQSGATDYGTEQVQRRWSLAWWLVAVVVAVAGWWLVQVTTGFSMVGCEGMCQDEVVWAALGALPWWLLTSLVAPIALAMVLSRTGIRTSWAGGVAVVLVIAVLVGTTLAVEAGLQPMRDRNQRIAYNEGR